MFKKNYLGGIFLILIKEIICLSIAAGGIALIWVWPECAMYQCGHGTLELHKAESYIWT